MPKSIVVAGIIDSINYGSVVQALATNSVLSEFGDVSFIGYQRGCNTYEHWRDYVLRDKRYHPVVNVGRVVLQAHKRERGEHVFHDCVREHLKLVDPEPFLTEGSELDPNAVYCVGSDQTWNYEYNGHRLDPIYCLLNVPDEYRKIALSASIGRGKIPDFEAALTYEALKGFDAISVRERSSVSLLDGIGIHGAVSLVDPVLMCDPDFWAGFGVRKASLPEEYILCYQLNANPAMVEYANYVSRRLGIPVVRIEYDWRRATPVKWQHELLPTVPEWVGMFQNATQVITDSFHGLCFSILNHNSMTVFDPPTYSVRLVDALDDFGIAERRVPSDQNAIKRALWQSETSWQEVDERLNEERRRARAFIRKAIGDEDGI